MSGHFNLDEIQMDDNGNISTDSGSSFQTLSQDPAPQPNTQDPDTSESQEKGDGQNNNTDQDPSVAVNPAPQADPFSKETVNGQEQPTNPAQTQAIPEDQGSGQENPNKDQSNLTPFHEHPDWIKMQEKVRELELEKARLEGAQSVLTTKSPDLQPVADTDREFLKKTPLQHAEEMLRAEGEKGWQPKDQVEINVKLREFERQAENQQREIVTRIHNEEQRQFVADVETAITGLPEKLTDDQATLVKQTAAELEKRGIIQSSAPPSQVIPYVYDSLKNSGALNKTADNSQNTTTVVNADGSKSQIATPQPAAQSVATTNQRIAQPGASNGTGTTNPTDKPDYNYIKNNDLDTIIADQINKI